METLVNLLNEYAKENNSAFAFVEYDESANGFSVLDDGKVAYLGAETILSLQYGFIDWLWEKGYLKKEVCREDDDFKFLEKHYEAQDASLMCLATRYSSLNLLIDWLENGKTTGMR